jgi:hypothetical protein
MKATLSLVSLLLFAIPCFSQEKPDTPKPNRRIFIVGVSALAVSKVADSLSTRSLLDRGGWENNPILGRHPSSGRISGYMAATFIGESTTFYFTERNHRSWVRWIGRAYIGLVVEEHVRLAACNARVNVHSSHAQNCRSFLPF